MTRKQDVRVDWTETRPDGLVCIIAEWAEARWVFWERDSWEVRWYKIDSQPQLVATAERLRQPPRDLAPMRCRRSNTSTSLTLCKNSGEPRSRGRRKS